MNRILFILVFGLFSTGIFAQEFTISNETGDIKVEISLDEEGIPLYQVFHRDQPVLEPSALGVLMEDADFSRNMSVRELSDKEMVTDDYHLLHGKQKEISYEATRYVLHLENEEGTPMDIIFQLSDDGLAFRYYFPGTTQKSKIITEERTFYNFPEQALAWLQPMSRAKTGWEQTNPSYEEHYVKGVSVNTEPEIGEGWVYPALFKVDESWILISEADLHRNYSGTRLLSDTRGEGLQVGLPQEEEVFPGGDYRPQSRFPWYSPWRILSIGDLATVTGSTLGTDLAAPAKQEDTQYVEPGLASWSWALLKDASVNYETTKEFIDYAADMDWSYCLVDVNWDQNIGSEGIKELAAYAKEKGVGLLVWYNSSGSWNNTPYTPKSKLLSAGDRQREFSMLNELGVAGVKVDFFGGDGQSMIAYYHDMLEDAAAHELLINFHGATLPRGWHRTYPNLLTVEAVKGLEFITFTQEDADKAASHAAMQPYTRNVFDPMDFTPMVLDSIPNINRQTTPAFELALPVLFQSGLQHIGETPAGMAQQPDYVKEYLKDIPVLWDESRYLEGFPGEDAVFARRKGEVWHIVGINGENEEKTYNLDLSFVGDGMEAVLISDGENGFMRKEMTLPDDGRVGVEVKAYGGFVIKIE